MRAGWMPSGLILLLGLLFFWPLLLHPAEVLYSDYSDVLALHLPAKHFLVQSWRETGELPLWCPYQFAGEPFVADIMAATFYPPHLLLLLLPPQHVGAALSWLVVFHVIVAGWCMYGYGRWRGLSVEASLVAAVGFMFAGSWLQRMLLGGHYLLIGLAWLPLVVLLLERAIERSRLVWATAAGCVFGLLILGTAPQFTFYASLLIALWTFGAAQELARVTSWRKALLRWLGYGLWMLLVGAALAAVQLLPTMEAAGLSSRALGVGSEEILGGGLRSILFLVGPALTAEPANLQWEDRGGLAFLWLFAAVIAGWLGQSRVRYEAGVALLLLLFAIGGAILVQGLPGFRLFRQPTRMFTLLGFPIAFLAGTATQLFFTTGDPSTTTTRRRILVRLLGALVILSGGFVLRQYLEHKPLRLHLYWLSLLVTVPAAYWLMGKTAPSWQRRGLLSWGFLLFIDLWALTLPLVETRSERSLYGASACVDWLIHQSDKPGRILDHGDYPGGSATPLGAGAPLAMIHRLEALRGYNSIDNLRYKEYLQFIAGSDAPLQAQSGPLTYPVLGDFPIVHKKLLDLLNVRYLLSPSELVPEHPSEWRAVTEDTQPQAFDFIAGGLRELPAYTVWENRTVLPRAFVVLRHSPLPQGREILPRLLATDFRKEVLLENDEPSTKTETVEETERHVVIRRYEPNRVVVEVEPGPEGWLVLTDIWYPGWKCHINDKPVSIERANYLFRAVLVPKERCEIVFSYEPESYSLGRTISLATLGVVGCIFVVALASRMIRLA